MNKPSVNQVCSFIKKLYHMVSSAENFHSVAWTPDGRSIIIVNEQSFSSNILPKYFKHSNYCSFVRQLNMYNFHKVRQSQHSICFTHQNFRKDKKDILLKIKRKPQRKSLKQKFKQQNQNNQNQLKHNDQSVTKVSANSKKTLKKSNIDITQHPEEIIIRQITPKQKQIRRISICQNISISNDLNQFSPRRSGFGDLTVSRNNFDPINFDAFVCSYNNFLK